MEKDRTIFDGSEGKFISAAEAARRQERYLIRQAEAGEKDPIRAQFFGRDILEKMLSKDGAVGLRIYHGINDENQSSLIIVPTDKSGKNLVLDNTGLKDMPDGDDHAADGPGCPMHC